jgi:hypothetical protein
LRVITTADAVIWGGPLSVCDSPLLTRGSFAVYTAESAPSFSERRPTQPRDYAAEERGHMDALEEHIRNKTPVGGGGDCRVQVSNISLDHVGLASHRAAALPKITG